MKSRLLFVCAAFLPAAGLLWADDSPQFRGPNRDGVSTDVGLLKEWPKGGPKLLWKIKNLGGGYSAVSVASRRIFTMGDKGGEDYLIALHEKDGSKIWSKALGKSGKNPPGGNNYPGPRCTPTVDGDRVYALSSDGDLTCLDVADGKVIWKKSYRTDFSGKPGSWAFSESPLIDGEKVIVTPGGPGATLVALNKADGKLVWKAAVPGNDKAAYSSAIVAEVGGVRQYIQVVHGGAVGVDAKTGKFLWRFKGGTNGTANIPSPLFHDNAVFVLSGYGAGAALGKLKADGDKVAVSQAYPLKKLTSQIGGAVRVGNYIYAAAGSWMCIDWATGKDKWTDRSVGAGSVCYADGFLYLRGQGGQVALVEATPAGYKEHGRFTQPDRSAKPAWAYPVVANGRLYLRDMDALLCYDVKGNAS